MNNKRQKLLTPDKDTFLTSTKILIARTTGPFTIFLYLFLLYILPIDIFLYCSIII